MRAYLAPLEGITTHVYRNAYHHHFRPLDKYFTPFIVPASKRPLRTRERRDVDPENNKGLPVIPQILTNDAAGFLETAEALEALGYTEVNLNLGCPSGTVTSRGKGAGFLKDPDALDAFLEQIFDGCRLKISLKTRLGWADPEEVWEILNVIDRYPVSEWILHPRVRQEFYRGETHRDIFLEVLKKSRHSLIYNGNLFTAEDIRQICGEAEAVCAGMQEQDHFAGVMSCQDHFAGVMPGRGLIAQPALWSHYCGETVTISQLKDFHDEIYDGYHEILSGDDPVIHKMKELWCYMVQGFTESERYEKRFHKLHRRSDYEALVREIFTNEEVSLAGFVPPDGWQIPSKEKHSI